jgi:hypothetical protein
MMFARIAHGIITSFRLCFGYVETAFRTIARQRAHQPEAESKNNVAKRKRESSISSRLSSFLQQQKSVFQVL